MKRKFPDGISFPARCEFCKRMAVNLRQDRCRRHEGVPKLRLIVTSALALFFALTALCACGAMLNTGNCQASYGFPVSQSSALDCPRGSMLTRVEGNNAYCAPLIVNCPTRDTK